MSHECQRCGQSKPAAEMVKRGGKPSKTCVECFRTAMADHGGRKRNANGTARPKARKARQVEVAPEPVTIDGPSLEVLPGFGFRSSVEGDRLIIEQDDTEARVLFAQFHDWVHA